MKATSPAVATPASETGPSSQFGTDDRSTNNLKTWLVAFALAIAIAAPSAARAQDLPTATVAVQAVEPTGDGRARVSDCSGVLIERSLVLTAGHCLDGVDRPQHVAVFAFERGAPKPVPLPVAAFARHPDHVVGWRQKAGDPSTRRSEIAADLALLRLAEPLSATPAELGGGASPPLERGATVGVGPSAPGGRGGRTKRIALAATRLATGDGPRVAFASAGATVCGGDSGGPAAVSADGPARVWGVVAAILRSKGGCGTRIVITPVDPSSDGFRRMRSALGGD